MIKFTFNAMIQQPSPIAPEIGVVWLRPLHTAKKHCPTMFDTATVRPKKLGPIILYNTPLSCFK